MAKQTTLFYCQSCGHESGKWLGRCPGCGEWNTFAEEAAPAAAPAAGQAPRLAARAAGARVPSRPLSEVPADAAARWSTGLAELDALLGGGVVPGSAVLVGGEPGIGKSTLLLQLAGRAAAAGRPVLYVAAEESLSQVRLRADRLRVAPAGITALASGSVEDVLAAWDAVKPELVIVDSVQAAWTGALASAPGSLGQVRECAARLVEQAKAGGAACFLAGHVTKDGGLAGPKVLEHMVDTVIYFEGPRDRELRLLRAVKNRFGGVDEVGVLVMGDAGLAEAADPDRLFIEAAGGGPSGAPGASLVAALEGNRVLLAELQALVTDGSFGTSTRAVDGVEAGRVLRLAAVLDRRCGLALAGKDVFVNVTGGLSIGEPAVDLALALAIASAHRDLPLPRELVACGEVSLLGEVRRISQAEKRALAAKKLGLKSILLPAANAEDVKGVSGLEIVFVSTLREALAAALAG